MAKIFQCAVLMTHLTERDQEYTMLWGASSAWALLGEFVESSQVSTGRPRAVGDKEWGPGRSVREQGLFKEGKGISYIIHSTASHCLLHARHYSKFKGILVNKMDKNLCLRRQETAF